MKRRRLAVSVVAAVVFVRVFVGCDDERGRRRAATVTGGTRHISAYLYTLE